MEAIVSSATTDDETIHAAPLQGFFSTLGQTIGIAIGSSIFLNQFDRHMTNDSYLNGSASIYVKSAVGLVDVVRSMPAAQARLRLELVESYVTALGGVWTTMCVLAGICLALTIWTTMASRPVRREQVMAHELDGRSAV